MVMDMSADRPQHPGQPDQQEDENRVEEPLVARSSELVVSHPPPAVVTADSRPRALTELRRRLPDLSRNPVLVATATAAAAVGAGLAVNIAQKALGRIGSTSTDAARPGVVIGYVVVHHVHVVHHVVQHVQRAALPASPTRPAMRASTGPHR
jgi:hypothetical protein